MRGRAPGVRSLVMTEPPYTPPRPKPARRTTSPVARETLGVLDEATERVLRATWPDKSIEAGDFVRIGLEIYGTEDRWRREIAADLVLFRPAGKGSMPSAGALDRSLIRRWASGEKPIPPWVGPALLKIPSIAIARMRAHIDHLRAQVAEFDAALVEEERRMDGVLRGWVARYAEPPRVVAPPPGPRTRKRDWPAVSTDDAEAAQDAGSSAYEIFAGLSDDETTGRPDHPELAEEWDAGWREANAAHRERHAAVVERAKAKG
ncbi:MAG: hypothetical protein ABJF67_06550 [Aurantimonas coralicida]